jgi:hypothetical protein
LGGFEVSRFIVTAKYFTVESVQVDADSAVDAERLGLVELDPYLSGIPGTLTVETVEL